MKGWNARKNVLGLLYDFRKFDYQNFLPFFFLIYRNRISFPILPWSGRHLARPGVAPPLVGGLSAVSFLLYSTADMSIALLITQQA